MDDGIPVVTGMEALVTSLKSILTTDAGLQWVTVHLLLQVWKF